MVDIDAAIGFVLARGEAVDRARLSHLRTGATPGAELYDQLERGQTPAGGWPAKPGRHAASVDATCLRLAELDDLAGLGRPAAKKALRWLAAVQRADGCWEEDRSLAGSAPPWATPGDPDARFYLTASAAYWLCLGDSNARGTDLGTRSTYAGAIDRAADAIREQVDETGAWPGFLASGWLAGAVLQRSGWFYEAARIFVALADRVPTMSAGDAASLTAALRRAGIDPGESLLVAARARLSQTQRPDGAWPGDDDRAFDVQTTLTALRALR
jgi:hypothetical protein